MSSVERAPRFERMRRQELFCRAAPLIAQHGQEFPLGVELGGSAKIGHRRARNAVDTHLCPSSALAIARIGDLPEHRDHTKLLQQGGIEGNLVHSIENLLGGARGARPFHGIDLNQDCIA